MAGNWDNSIHQYIELTADGASAAGSGAFTMAVLWLSGPFTNFNTSLATLYNSGGTEVRSLIWDDSGGLFAGSGDNSGGATAVVAAATWYVSAVSKAAGSNVARFHHWAYESDGSGSMSHAGSTGTPTSFGDPGAIAHIRLGEGVSKGNCDIAAVGIWNSALSDANLNTLKSAALQDWADLSPAVLLSMENWNGTTGVADEIGTAAQDALSGSVTASANPDDFDFTVTAPGGTDFTASPADAVGITDAVATVLTVKRTVADNVGITDDAEGEINNTTVTVLIEDSVGITDTGDPYTIDRFVTMNDAEGVTDRSVPNSPGTDFIASISDTVGVTEHITAIKGPGGPGFSPALADELMDQAASEYRWIRLHVGPPGPSLNENLAGNAVRRQVLWAPSGGGVLVSSTILQWNSVAATEEYTFYTACSAQTGGTPGWSGTVGDGVVNAGDTAIIDAGDLQAILPVAS